MKKINFKVCEKTGFTFTYKYIAAYDRFSGLDEDIFIKDLNNELIFQIEREPPGDRSSIYYCQLMNAPYLEYLELTEIVRKIYLFLDLKLYEKNI